MKRTFFNPARFITHRRTGYSGSRSLRFGSACFKTDANADDETADEKAEREALVSEMKKQVGIQFNERGLNDDALTGMKNILTAWEKFPLEALRAMADKETGVMKSLEKQGLEIQELRTKGLNGTGDKPLGIRAQIKNWHENETEITLEDGTKVKQASANSVFRQIRAGIKVAPPVFELELRAPNVPMTPANSFTGDFPALPIAEVDYTLNDIPRRAFTLWDYLTKGRASRAVRVWINKTNPQGAAGFLAPGELKPFISFEIETGMSTPKKVADAEKVALETLEDIDQFESWMKDELRYQLLLAVNTALMTSDGVDPDAPTGIQALSVAFTATGLVTTNPNYMDAIRAVVAQMRSGNLSGDIVVFINPIDSANMDMAKATTSGVYLLPAFVTANGRTIAGATIVEDANIPVGSFQAAYLRYYRILIYKPMTISFGWENDDFRRNLLTYLCEMRFFQEFNEMYTGAFVFDTFANVLAAIAA